MLRALLAWRMGFERGTQTAITVGQFFAMAFMVFGIMTFNVILLLIAVFIFAAGAAEAQLIELRRAVAGLTAADVMHQAARRLDAGVPVSQALRSVGRWRAGSGGVVARQRAGRAHHGAG